MRAFRRLLCVSFVLSLSFIASLQATVIGTVINIDGKGIGGAKVSLFAPELISGFWPRALSAEPQRKALATMTTDSSGKFTFDVPKDQNIVDVRVEAAGYAPSGVRLAADDDAGAMLLTQAPSVRGTITANGKPVANATVTIIGGAEYTTKTDADGHYTAPDPSKWALVIIVIHPDFAVLEELVGPTAPKKGVDFSMNAGVAITGRVVAEDGQTPVADAQLSVDSWPAGKSAADGTFTIAHAKKDWESVQARKDNRVAERARGTLTSSTLKLGKGATVSGNVRDVKSQLPVVGARVEIAPSGRFGSRVARIDAVTDAKGNFTIGPLVAGTYDARPTRPGYGISNAQGMHLKAADSVQKALYATARARISGSVLDEDKRPVGATRLETRPARRNNDIMAMINRGGTASEGYSAPDGHFVLRNVEPDSDIQVDAVKRGYPVAKSPTLKLAAGERKTGVMITIPHGIAVTGRVTDKDRKPLSGVAVEAIESSQDAGAGVRRMVISSLQGNRNDELVRTGSDGTFSIRVKEGTYDLAFKREGFSAKTVRATKVDATTKPVEVMLNPGVEISGRVTRGGVGVEGVNVRSISQDGMGTATTLPDGTFAITDLTPGTMMLNVAKPDSFIQEMRSVTAPARDVNIELPPGGRITGHVLDKNSHQPVTSFMAGVTTSRSGGGMVMMMPPMQKQFTSDDGSFVLEGIKPGSTQVVVNAPGYTTARVPNIEVEDGKTGPDVEVDVESGSKLTGRVTGPDGSPLAGVSVGTNPLAGGAGGRVMRFDGNDNSATTDPSGEYSIDSIDAGEKNFTFSRSGFIAQQKTVTIVAGKDARLDAQMSTGMQVTGQVVSDGGAPIPDVSVRALSASEMDGGREGRSDANGAFTIEGLAPGHYTFTASKSGFSPATLRDVDIATSGPVRVVMKNGGVISGHVTGLTAAELEQATVSASVSGSGGGGGPFGGGNNASAPVDASGSYRIEGAPSGTVRVTARTGAAFGGSIKSAAPMTVELDAGGSAQVDIDFKSNTVIRGRVTLNGAPIARAQVTFIPRGGRSQTVNSQQADSDGRYEISGLDDGSYVVQAMDTSLMSPFTMPYEVHGSGTFDITIKAVTVKGNVVDSSDSKGLYEATVQLSATGQAMLGGRTIQTDAAGNFTLENIASGTYQITADKSGYGHDMRQITVGDSAPEDVQFHLTPGDGITIRAIDSRDNSPLTVNVVRIVDSNGSEVPLQSGFFNTSEVVTLAVAPGRYQVTVSARNYAPQTISMPSPSQQTVRFSPGGTLVLHSKDSNGRRFKLIDSSGNTYNQNSFSLGIFPLPPGTTTLNNVTPGHYHLQIIDKTSDRVLNTLEIDVADGQPTDINV